MITITCSHIGHESGKCSFLKYSIVETRLFFFFQNRLDTSRFVRECEIYLVPNQIYSSFVIIFLHTISCYIEHWYWGTHMTSVRWKCLSFPFSKFASFVLTYRQTSNIRRTCVSYIICWSLSNYSNCSNYIFILNLTHGFNELGKTNSKTIRESFKFCD